MQNVESIQAKTTTLHRHGNTRLPTQSCPHHYLHLCCLLVHLPPLALVFSASLGSLWVPAIFNLSHSIFQASTALSCPILICFHWSSHASLATLFDFQALVLWSFSLALVSFSLASLSTDKTKTSSVICLPSPFHFNSAHLSSFISSLARTDCFSFLAQHTGWQVGQIFPHQWTAGP